MKKIRLDELLISREIVSDKKEAFLLVTEGYAIVEGQKAVSPAQMVHPNASLKIRARKKYVGRGALKLNAAVEEFKLDVKDKICVDIGAATGGFTEILLLNGATKVYAIDTAHGKLDLKLREDPRVVVMEQTDIRKVDSLPDPIDIAVADVSLIPLEWILPHAQRLLKSGGEMVALVKPQYQTRDSRILRHGVVQDDAAREELLSDITSFAKESGWEVFGTMTSPIRGGQGGNTEYLIHLRKQ